MPRGIDCKLYYYTGSYASPTWAEINAVADIKVDESKDEFEITTRNELGLKVFDATTISFMVAGKIRVPGIAQSDADYLALRNTFYANTVLEYLVLDGEATANGASGMRFFGKVFKWNEDQSMGVSTFREFEIKPTVSTTLADKAARRVLVAAGAPTYADIGSSTFA